MVIRSWWSASARVARHRLGEVIAADEVVDLVDLLGDEAGGLTSQVCAYHDYDRLGRHKPAPRVGRGVRMPRPANSANPPVKRAASPWRRSGASISVR